MPIIVQCSGCKSKFRAGDKLLGKQVKCPKCPTVIEIPIVQQNETYQAETIQDTNHQDRLQHEQLSVETAKATEAATNELEPGLVVNPRDPLGTAIHWFLILIYCGLAAAFFFLCSRVFQVHFIWNVAFSLLASGTVTASIVCIVDARLCRVRLLNAIKNQATADEIQAIVETAFGITPDLKNPIVTGLAFLPIAIVTFVFLAPFIDSYVWRGGLSVAVALPLSSFVELIVNLLAAQKRSWERAKKTITDYDPQIWNKIEGIWTERRKVQAAEKEKKEKELALAREDKMRRKAEEREKVAKQIERQKAQARAQAAEKEKREKAAKEPKNTRLSQVTTQPLRVKTSKGLKELEMTCTRDDLLGESEYVEKASELIAAEGADAARGLAELISELLRCRSQKIDNALFAAKRALPVPELLRAVSEVVAAKSLAPTPSGVRFQPQIAGAGQVGWDDGTTNRLHNYASQVLEHLKQRQASPSSQASSAPTYQTSSLGKIHGHVCDRCKKVIPESEMVSLSGNLICKSCDKALEQKVFGSFKMFTRIGTEDAPASIRQKHYAEDYTVKTGRNTCPRCGHEYDQSTAWCAKCKVSI